LHLINVRSIGILTGLGTLSRTLWVFFSAIVALYKELNWPQTKVNVEGDEG
jgi:hypothetical protein